MDRLPGLSARKRGTRHHDPTLDCNPLGNSVAAFKDLELADSSPPSECIPVWHAQAATPNPCRDLPHQQQAGGAPAGSVWNPWGCAGSSAQPPLPPPPEPAPRVVVHKPSPSWFSPLMGFGGPASMVWQQEQLVADAARRAKQQGMPAAQHPLRPPLAQAAAQQAQHAAQRQQQAQAAQAQPSAAPVAGQPQVPPDATQPLLFSQPLGQQVANLGQRSPPWYQQGWGQQQPQQQQAAPPPLPPRQPPPPQPQEPALPRSSHGSLWSGSKAGAQRVRGNPFVSESEEAVGGGGPGVTCAPPGAAHAAVGVGSSRPAGKLPPPPRFLLVSRGGPSQAVQQQAHVQHRHAEQPHSQPQEPQQQQPHITGQQQQTQQRAASPALPSSAHEPAVQPGLPPPQPPAPMVMAAAGSSQVAQPPPPPPPPLRPAVGGGTAVPPPPPPPPPPLSPPCRSAPTAVRGALAPAPPAQLATAHVHASCTASSAPAVVDAGSCGLSDIKPSELAAAAARLRRVDAATAGGGREPGPGTTAATAGDFRAQLMAAIQGRRFQLRPVEKQQQRPSVQGSTARTDGMAELLRRVVERRRLAGSDSSDSDSEW